MRNSFVERNFFELIFVGSYLIDYFFVENIFWRMFCVSKNLFNISSVLWGIEDKFSGMSAFPVSSAMIFPHLFHEEKLYNNNLHTKF